MNNYKTLNPRLWNISNTAINSYMCTSHLLCFFPVLSGSLHRDGRKVRRSGGNERVRQPRGPPGWKCLREGEA